MGIASFVRKVRFAQSRHLIARTAIEALEGRHA
jgi:hypothetical protein